MSAQVTLGKLGEALVSDLFKIKLSEDEFDTVKDGLTFNGQTVEIKTQNRHPTKPILTISAPAQGKGLVNVIKCFTVDNLIFVEYDSSDIIKIWLCNDRSNYEIYETKAGKQMIGFPVSDMKLLVDHEDSDLAAQMRSLSKSTVFRK